MHVIKRDFRTIAAFALRMILVWILATSILSFFQNFGIEDFEYYKKIKDFDFKKGVIETILFGTLTGIFCTILELIFDRQFFQKLSFWKLIVVKNVFYFISIRFIFLLFVIQYLWMYKGFVNMVDVRAGMNSDSFWVLMLFFMLVSVSISFVLQISQKFGPGMLWKFFIGKYHTPKEVERIFLFIDLRSSTTIAEQLGHIKFSSLIQDCFFDLTDVVIDNNVDVYQYVGDEAVLSWEKDMGLEGHRCLHAYFQFMEILNNRADYYQNKYGLLPFFKAGIHMGTVTAAEVGIVKKEIAYHGDVLNTAARIQGQCNKLGQPLLVSETMIENINMAKSDFTAELMSTPLLRGKSNPVKIYGVQTLIKRSSKQTI